jgi:diaminopimelate epimerase
MPMLKFTKMHGAGNDFIVISESSLRSSGISLTKDNIEFLCNRQLGVGADGLIIIAYDFALDFKMLYYNSDGNEAEMCGNGARCAFAFANQLGLVSDIGVFSTGSGAVHGELKSDTIKVSLPMTNPPQLDLQLSSSKTVHFANTGVPHAVIITESVSGLDVENLGPEIRYDSHFAPNGVNVNWIEKQQENVYKIRTYERGVEAETLACGTGASASALILFCLNLAISPVTLITKGGDELIVDINQNDDKYELHLTGPAKVAFNGEVELND